HSSRRNRRAGADAQIGSGATRPESRSLRNHGELHVGLHCGNTAVTAEIQDALEYVEWRTQLRPKIAVVLGSGLGAFADELQEPCEIAYSDIPAWPMSTAVGHAGKLVIGKLGNLELAVMSG